MPENDGTKTTKFDPDLCPTCGAKMDATLSLEGFSPSEGDISICAVCAAINIFGPDMKLRPVLEEELRQWPITKLAEIISIQVVVTSARKANRAHMN